MIHMSRDVDEAFMRRALELARRAWGETHPNPMVGAVLVENGVIVAEGWHERAGALHAERKVLQALGRPPQTNATLYVTLEPCSSIGRTPACVDMILSAGIQRVVVGAIDPNPAHAGGGLKHLREAGVEVIEGVLAGDCEDLNLIFHHRMRTGTPLLAAKIATTLDGKIATRSGHAQWITGEAARQDVMRWRRYFPAIAVGAGTVLADNPHLSARIEGKTEHCPLRLMFDHDLRTATAQVNVFTDSFTTHTRVICTSEALSERKLALDKLGVERWELPHTHGRTDIDAFKAKCLSEGIDGVLFEGGRALLSHLLKTQALDYLFHYQAPKLLADDKALPAFNGLNVERLEGAVQLRCVRHARFGDDQLLRGFLTYPSTR